MSIPSIVKGQFFSVAVDPQRDGTFTTICGMTTRSFEEAVQSSKEYLRDCADPTMVPVGVVNVTGIDATISGTAFYNRAQADLMRSLIGQSFPYRFVMGEDAQDPVDSGYYEGNFVLTNRQITAPDGTNVTANLTWQSDGEYAWTPGAEIVILDPLDLTPKEIEEDAVYSGTVAGTTAGSTLTATSSDSTALTVTGTGTSRTIATDEDGFATPGNKTITLTETLADASNSPRVTHLTVVVTAAA
jgi:Phage tail tube protein